MEESVLVSVQQTDEGSIHLLRKIGSLQSQRVISVASDFEWFSELQASITANENILLVAKDDPTNGVLGLINTLKVEYQNQSISCVYLMDDGPNFGMDEGFYKNQLRKRLLMNIWKDGTWGTYVLFPLNDNNEECDRASGIVEKGNLSSFRWVQAPTIPHELPAAEVHYVGLSYNDVLLTTGRLPSKSKSNEVELGLEFSGINSRCERVMGIARRGALFNTLPTDQSLTWKIPDHWSLEEAATIPLTYCSALYALVMVAKLKKGQSVLIHAGAGGVGQSAINIALGYNCTVFATVGSLKKKEVLSGYFPNLPDDHIGNSRDSRFQQFIMKKTGGKGVDIVLNSLSIRKLQTSALCLSRGGILLEMGRINVAKNQYLDFSCISKSRTFFCVNMDSVFCAQNSVKKSLHKYLGEGIQIGYVKPIHSQIFEKSKVEDALSYMTGGTHIGKVVIKLRDEKTQMNSALHASPRFYCNSSKVYILVGGLGGFGLELADWLVNRGARKLVIVSTRNTLTDYQNFKVEFWRENEVRVVIARQNLLSLEGCEDLINESGKLGPIEAIFNLAIVLNDALFENQTAERFLLSFGPKALVTKNLDIVTRRFCTHLRYFVVFSSLTCGKGNVGQTSYGMANSIMERICEIRKEEGYPAIAIQWGAIADVGVLENSTTCTQEILGGTVKQKVAVYLKVLDRLLTQKDCIVTSSVPPNINETDSAPVNNMAEVVKFLGTDLTHVSLNATLSQLGMDSIIGVKIKQFLQDNYGIAISIRELRSVTLTQLSESNLGMGQP
ncbi:hypothetical protein RI129_012373 [Pyrocoelia pectoralis]|uniref:Carrier domain-containing protein n=1 Tax=Pyrocoelia pectoralis TaxID=417401 RepID=A0AAN7ZFU8_9COLE